jgi:tyrosyl-tRNA synthetase
MSKNLIEELRWRGLLQDFTPEVEELFSKEKVKGYVGFDPTADSLHIGNLVPIMLLVHLQLAGHQPVALVGGATGMVGDPSGKTAERKLLSIDEINHNLESQKKQLMKFLDFSGENAAEIVNNYDWFKGIGFLDFIRDVGKHITVNYMMSKDSVQNRLEAGMSFTEFSYQLVQGYDFYWLYQNKGIKLQMGGSDQWGNITTGTELIRRMCQGHAHALTAPLVKKADGTKFGKSEGGNVWLDANKTSPYKFYQYWINSSDVDASSFIRIFTLLDKAEIEAIESEHQAAPHTRILQKTLAEQLTLRVHGKAELEAAISASNILFGQSTKDDLFRLNEGDLLAVFEGVPQATISLKELELGVGLIDALGAKTGFLASNGEARRTIKEKAISLNKEKVEDENFIINKSHLINNKYILLQKGKKNYYLLIAE